MNGFNFLLKRVVHPKLLSLRTHAPSPVHHLLHLTHHGSTPYSTLIHHIHARHADSACQPANIGPILCHLLLIILNKSRSHHIDAVLALDFITVVKQKCLKTSQFLLNGLHGDFIYRLANLQSIHRGKQLFRNV